MGCPDCLHRTRCIFIIHRTHTCRYAVWFGGSLMASLVRRMLSCLLCSRNLVTDICNHPAARVLLVLPHESAVRRDRTEHLQALPDLWKRHINGSAVLQRRTWQCVLSMTRKSIVERMYFSLIVCNSMQWTVPLYLISESKSKYDVRDEARLCYVQLEQLHWNPKKLFSPILQYRFSSLTSADSSSSDPSRSSAPQGSKGLHDI